MICVELDRLQNFIAQGNAQEVSSIYPFFCPIFSVDIGTAETAVRFD